VLRNINQRIGHEPNRSQIAHREWMPQRQTVDQHFYLEVLKILR